MYYVLLMYITNVAKLNQYFTIFINFLYKKYFENRTKFVKVRGFQVAYFDTQ